MPLVRSPSGINRSWSIIELRNTRLRHVTTKWVVFSPDTTNTHETSNLGGFRSRNTGIEGNVWRTNFKTAFQRNQRISDRFIFLASGRDLLHATWSSLNRQKKLWQKFCSLWKYENALKIFFGKWLFMMGSSTAQWGVSSGVALNTPDRRNKQERDRTSYLSVLYITSRMTDDNFKTHFSRSLSFRHAPSFVHSNLATKDCFKGYFILGGWGGCEKATGEVLRVSGKRWSVFFCGEKDDSTHSRRSLCPLPNNSLTESVKRSRPRMQ